NFEIIKRIAYDVILGLSYLNRRDIVHRSLSLENVLLDVTGRVKLSQYGRYFMTNHGTAADFPIGSPRYLAPEILLRGPQYSLLSGASSSKADVWSLGIVLTELVL
ncbi:TBC domain-containing kinase, partial [Paramuricea clavata]